MKPVVLFLALLAAAKLGQQEYLFRTGTRDAILAAYREHATEACQRQARGLAAGVPAETWASSATIQLVIGDSSLDVNLWQVDNALWSARYRNPYLLLTAGQPAGTLNCAYDILNAAASVHRP